MIDRSARSQAGRVSSADPATRTLVTESAIFPPVVATCTPPQKAGRIAEIAGAADATGWCPIDPASFQSKLVPNIHAVGDACIAGAIPKSASPAHAQAAACAAGVVALMAGKTPELPRLTGACFNTVAPGYAFSLTGVYGPREGLFNEVEGGGPSSLDAPREVRAQEAETALTWFRTITADTFG